MADRQAIPPGGIIGILGGGQLGRMLALAAAEIGLRTHIYCPDPDSPAFDVAADHTIADYDDWPALDAFAALVDVVTYEFENVPAATAERLAVRVPVRPGPRALAVAQDRLAEKDFVAGLGLPVAPYRPVDSACALSRAIEDVGLPAVLKTRRLGYDGKGQALIREGDDPVQAFAAIGEQPAILEAMVPFEREVSILIARGLDGATAHYSLCENWHCGGILRRTTVPAAAAPATAAAAVRIGTRIAAALDYVGLLAVELFVVGSNEEERLSFNEMAPRVHNSGHWTREACAVSQFENHIRAVAGWPLGSPDRHADAVMENLIGDEVEDWNRLAGQPGALRLYGKREARPGRKMGHLVRLSPRE